METVTGFIFLGSKITADSDHEIKRCSLDSILKSRNITLVAKVHIVKAMVFPVLMDGCESWIIKQVVCQRTDFLICGVGVYSCKEFKPVNPKGNPS